MSLRITSQVGSAVLGVGILLAGCSGGLPEGAVDESLGVEGSAVLTGPNGKGVGTLQSPPPVRGANLLTAHGGPVMSGQVNVYYIWYGNWSGNTATSILTDLAQSIGGSPYYNINTLYSDASHTVSNNVHYAGSATDSYGQGASLDESSSEFIVSQALSQKALPYDPNGVYFVLTSPDVTLPQGFCSQYCGFHKHAVIDGVDIKYAFVGDAATQCASSCIAQPGASPNRNAGADGMASIIAHELSTAVTDPDLNAWYNVNNKENADRCDWTFGTTYKASGGGNANVHLGTRDYLLQENFVNVGAGSCALSSACVPNPAACGSAQCGTAADGCGGTVSCGTCGAGSSCVSGACQCTAQKCTKGHWDPTVCACVVGLPK